MHPSFCSLVALSLYATLGAAERDADRGDADRRDADRARQHPEYPAPTPDANELIGESVRLDDPGRYKGQIDEGSYGFILGVADRNHVLVRGKHSEPVPYDDREFYVHFEKFYNNVVLSGRQISLTGTETAATLVGRHVRLIRAPVRSNRADRATLFKAKRLGVVTKYLGSQLDMDTRQTEETFQVQMLTEPPDLQDEGAPIHLYRHEFATVELAPSEALKVMARPHDVYPRGTRVIVHNPLGREDRKSWYKDQIGTVKFFNDKKMTYSVLLDEFGKPATLRPEEIKEYREPLEVEEVHRVPRARPAAPALPGSPRADCNYTALAQYEKDQDAKLDSIKGQIEADVGDAVHDAVDKHNEYLDKLWQQHVGTDDLNDSIDKYRDAVNAGDEQANAKIRGDFEVGQEEVDLNLDLAKKWKDYNARRMYDMASAHELEELHESRHPRTREQILDAHHRDPQHPAHVRNVKALEGLLKQQEPEHAPELHEFLQSLLEPRTAFAIQPRSQMTRSVSSPSIALTQSRSNP